MKLQATLAAISLVAGAPAAFAHHSVPAYFDVSKVVTVSGTVEEFKFQNPHSILKILVKTPGGDVQEWKAEASLAAWLVRNGWRPDMFKPGSNITITGSPARDPAAHMVRLFTVTLPDGRKLNANNGLSAN